MKSELDIFHEDTVVATEGLPKLREAFQKLVLQVKNLPGESAMDAAELVTIAQARREMGEQFAKSMFLTPDQVEVLLQVVRVQNVFTNRAGDTGEHMVHQFELELQELDEAIAYRRQLQLCVENDPNTNQEEVWNQLRCYDEEVASEVGDIAYWLLRFIDGGIDVTEFCQVYGKVVENIVLSTGKNVEMIQAVLVKVLRNYCKYASLGGAERVQFFLNIVKNIPQWSGFEDVSLSRTYARRIGLIYKQYWEDMGGDVGFFEFLHEVLPEYVRLVGDIPLESTNTEVLPERMHGLSDQQLQMELGTLHARRVVSLGHETASSLWIMVQLVQRMQSGQARFPAEDVRTNPLKHTSVPEVVDAIVLLMPKLREMYEEWSRLHQQEKQQKLNSTGLTPQSAPESESA